MPTSASTRDRGKEPIVYIVDNDESTRRALTALLTAGGYLVVAFARPTDFLAEYEVRRPACVLLDVHMPEMGGFEVQQRLNRSGSMLPVIVMTGHGDIHLEAQAMKNGAFDFLQKPFKADELFYRIEIAIRRSTQILNAGTPDTG